MRKETRTDVVVAPLSWADALINGQTSDEIDPLWDFLESHYGENVAFLSHEGQFYGGYKGKFTTLTTYQISYVVEVLEEGERFKNAMMACAPLLDDFAADELTEILLVGASRSRAACLRDATWISQVWADYPVWDAVHQIAVDRVKDSPVSLLGSFETEKAQGTVFTSELEFKTRMVWVLVDALASQNAYEEVCSKSAPRDDQVKDEEIPLLLIHHGSFYLKRACTHMARLDQSKYGDLTNTIVSAVTQINEAFDNAVKSIKDAKNVGNPTDPVLQVAEAQEEAQGGHL